MRCLILLAACGGAAAPPLGNRAAPTPSAVRASTTGVDGFSWGMRIDEARAILPKASELATGLMQVGDDGTLTHYAFDASGLRSIETRWVDLFPDMGACGLVWKEERTRRDAKLGPSQADNLAAYWTLPTAKVELACNPHGQRARLSLRYTP